MSSVIKILIVDDDEDDFLITSEYIRHIGHSNYAIEWCSNFDTAFHSMITCAYSLYFVDYRLGVKTGIELLKKAIAYGCEDPIILLTGKGNYEVDKEAIAFGAVDYLVKGDITMEKMERSIRYALERSSSMKAFKANERKYRNIFEQSKDVVFIATEQLHFIDVNNAVKNILGYDRTELLHSNLLDLIPQAQHKRFLQNSLDNNREVNDWEVELIAKNGERKSCIVTVSIEQDQDADSYVQGIIHDITSLKKMEKANLMGEKLAATGRLVRTLAHEVRNPLNNITLSTEQLLQENFNDNQLMYLEIIQRNGRRINDIITELLNTSKPTEIELQKELFQSILDEVIDAALDRITLKHIKLEITYPNHFIYLMADKEKLVIALLNIVINSLEAMPEHTGRLILNVAVKDSFVVVKIEDNGCGISEENISRLFEPYFTQKRNGMGLGLASTLNILQAHKAQMEVSSIMGEGTIFAITFPLADLKTRNTVSNDEKH